MKWRLIELNTYNAATNMAIDEAILDAVSKGISPPTIRFYKWKPYAVSLGVSQKLTDINFEACKNLNVDIVRRITGGRHVYHEGLTYSVIAPVELFDKDSEISYRMICSWLVDAFKKIGLSAEINREGDVVVNNKKISGSCKRIENNTHLQHGTIIYDLDLETSVLLLKTTKELFKDNVTSILENIIIDEASVYTALKESFLKDKEYEVGALTEYEEKRYKKLVKKYKSKRRLEKSTSKTDKPACYVRIARKP